VRADEDDHVERQRQEGHEDLRVEEPVRVVISPHVRAQNIPSASPNVSPRTPTPSDVRLARSRYDRVGSRAVVPSSARIDGS